MKKVRIRKFRIFTNPLSAFSIPRVHCWIILLILFPASDSIAETTYIEESPYKGFKVAPLEVSSEMPYSYKKIKILGSNMAYIDIGQGDPMLFLHGQPTSSYLWRNIIPHVEKQARIIAPDNIGFGKSDQPELDYTFGDHYRYIEAFINKLELTNITLVVHDWGSALGLHYARLHPEKIKAIVTMESILAPFLPAESYDSLPKGVGKMFRRVREPVKGKKLLIEDNYFIEGILPNSIVRPLAKEALEVYRQPFKTLKSRIQVNQWPNEMPIGKVPQETHDVVTAYNQWLTQTDKPWLFLYATRGALNPPKVADYWAKHGKRVETVYIGAGIHYVQEDQPYAIGRAISDWYRRISAVKD